MTFDPLHMTYMVAIIMHAMQVTGNYVYRKNAVTLNRTTRYNSVY